MDSGAASSATPAPAAGSSAAAVPVQADEQEVESLRKEARGVAKRAHLDELQRALRHPGDAQGVLDWITPRDAAPRPARVAAARWLAALPPENFERMHRGEEIRRQLALIARTGQAVALLNLLKGSEVPQDDEFIQRCQPAGKEVKVTDDQLEAAGVYLREASVALKDGVEQKLEFYDGLCTVVGPNGGGKSRLLRAIAWACLATDRDTCPDKEVTKITLRLGFNEEAHGVIQRELWLATDYRQCFLSEDAWKPVQERRDQLRGCSKWELEVVYASGDGGIVQCHERKFKLVCSDAGKSAPAADLQPGVSPGKEEEEPDLSAAAAAAAGAAAASVVGSDGAESAPAPAEFDPRRLMPEDARQLQGASPWNNDLKKLFAEWLKRSTWYVAQDRGVQWTRKRDRRSYDGSEEPTLGIRPRDAVRKLLESAAGGKNHTLTWERFTRVHDQLRRMTSAELVAEVSVEDWLEAVHRQQDSYKQAWKDVYEQLLRAARDDVRWARAPGDFADPESRAAPPYLARGIHGYSFAEQQPPEAWELSGGDEGRPPVRLERVAPSTGRQDDRPFASSKVLEFFQQNPISCEEVGGPGSAADSSTLRVRMAEGSSALTLDLAPGYVKSLLLALTAIEFGSIVLLDEPETFLRAEVAARFARLVHQSVRPADTATARRSALLVTHSRAVLRETPVESAVQVRKGRAKKLSGLFWDYAKRATNGAREAETRQLAVVKQSEEETLELKDQLHLNVSLLIGASQDSTPEKRLSEAEAAEALQLFEQEGHRLPRGSNLRKLYEAIQADCNANGGDAAQTFAVHDLRLVDTNVARLFRDNNDKFRENLRSACRKAERKATGGVGAAAGGAGPNTTVGEASADQKGAARAKRRRDSAGDQSPVLWARHPEALEVIFAKAVLFVEGSADELAWSGLQGALRERLASGEALTSAEVHFCDVTIIELGTCTNTHPVWLAACCQTPCNVILDGDTLHKGKAWTNTNGAPARNFARLLGSPALMYNTEDEAREAYRELGVHVLKGEFEQLLAQSDDACEKVNDLWKLDSVDYARAFMEDVVKKGSPPNLHNLWGELSRSERADIMVAAYGDPKFDKVRGLVELFASPPVRPDKPPSLPVDGKRTSAAKIKKRIQEVQAASAALPPTAGAGAESKACDTTEE